MILRPLRCVATVEAGDEVLILIPPHDDFDRALKAALHDAEVHGASSFVYLENEHALAVHLGLAVPVTVQEMIDFGAYLLAHYTTRVVATCVTYDPVHGDPAHDFRINPAIIRQDV